MTRVGLITFHGSHNYGSVLQAYALQTQISNLGHDVQIINLRNKAQRAAYPLIRLKGQGLKRVLHAGHQVSLLAPLYRRYRGFEDFMREHLVLTEEYTSGAEIRDADLPFETYVVGSDQVWNPRSQDFESAYFLDFAQPGRRRVAYAPSLGTTDFSTEQLQRIGDLIQGIDIVSVREDQGAQLLRQLTDKPVEVVCDPVVLADRGVWESLAVEPRWRRPYLLTYFLENNHGSRSQLEYLRKATGLQVVTLNEHPRELLRPYRQAFGSTPAEFVGLFKNASLVLTNSFHGTAFATLFNRPFFTVVGNVPTAQNPSNDSRKVDFLRRVGLESRILGIEEPSVREIFALDFGEANRRLEEYRTFSLNYLKKALSN